MNKQNWIHKGLLVLLCLLLMAVSLPVAAAQEADGKCSLTIKYLDENQPENKDAKPIAGAAFYAWHVAGPVTEPDGTYPLLDTFQGSTVKLTNRMNNADWEKAAQMLESRAEREKITVNKYGTTNDKGLLTFQNLDQGIWLVSGDPCTIEDYTYTPQTFFVVLPGWGDDGNPTYSVTVSPKFTHEVQPHETETEKPKNPLSGGLTVRKTVTGNLGDKNKEWHFTVTLDDTSINGTYGEMTFENGVAKFTLRHGESKSAAGLPAGTDYTVTEAEANADGYTTTVTGGQVTDGQAPAGQGTIAENSAATAEFVNHKAEPDPHKTEVTPGDGEMVQVGDEITYQITWQNYEAKAATVIIRDPLDKGVDFVSASGGGTYDDATHTVTWNLGEQEPDAEGFVTLTVRVNENAASAGSVKNQAHVKVGNNPEVETEIPTNPLPGTLMVNKMVTGNQGDKSKDWHFTVDLDDTSINGASGDMSFTNGVAKFALKHGESKMTGVLPAGTGYNVTEAEANTDGYTTSATGDHGTIPANDVAKAQFANRLAIPNPHKTELTPGDDTMVQVGDEITYQITWQNHEAEKAKVIIRDPLDQGVDFVSASDGGVYDATAHTVTWELGEQASDAEGTVTLTVKVNEKARPAGIVKNQAYVKVGNNPEVETEIPENPLPGSLTVRKTVTGNLGDQTREWHFTVTLSDTTINGTYGGMTFVDGVAQFTLKHGESKTAGGIPAGTGYTVTEEEANADGYTTTVTGGQVTDGQAPAGQGTIAENSAATAEFVNHKAEPDPHKTEVTPGDGEMVQVGDEITYQITWQNYEAEKATVIIRDPLDQGVDFVSASDGGSYDEATHTVTWNLGEKPSAAEGTVTLTVRVNENAVNADENAQPTGSVKNQAFVQVGNHPEVGTEIPENHLPGSLTVRKSVTGNQGDQAREWHFTVTLDDATVNGTYGEMTFVNGVAQFTLRHGESKSAAGLPAGTGYTVTEEEANTDGYTTSSAGDAGTIREADASAAEFVNRKAGPDPHKTEVTPQDGAPVQIGDEITYRITWQNYEAEEADIVIRDPLDPGVDFVSASDGGIYDAATHTVTWDLGRKPSDAEGFVSLTVKVNANAQPAGSVRNQAFVKVGNNPEVGTEIPENPLPGSLTVRKTVTGNLGDQTREWHFTVTLSDTTINGIYGGMTFVNGVAEFTLRHGQSRTAAGLPAGIGYTVTEAEADTDGYTTSMTGDRGTINASAAATAEFVNHKAQPDPHKTEVTPQDGAMVKTGDEITYRIDWQNYEAEKATVIIRDPLDPGVDFVSASDGGVYDAAAHTVTWNLGEQTSGAEGFVSLTVKVNEKAQPVGSVKNQAFVKVENNPEVRTEIPQNPLPGSLTVRKTVTGNQGDQTKAWHFTVTLDDKSVKGTYGEMTFKNGVAKFSLKHGESKSAAGLPAGTGYTVTEAEANADGYTTVVTSGQAAGAQGTSGQAPAAQGIIAEDSVATAEFVNHKAQPDNPQSDEPQPDNPQSDEPQPDNPQSDEPQSDNPQPGNPQSDDLQPGNPRSDDLQPGNPQSGNLPATGDDSPLGFWMILMLISLICIFVSGRLLFKDKHMHE